VSNGHILVVHVFQENWYCDEHRNSVSLTFYLQMFIFVTCITDHGYQ
jgi:hypothetical protein